MRTYQCHKKVKAAQIKSIGSPTPDGVEVLLDDDTKLQLKREVTARYFPIQGDYVVVYEDGYTSISPQQAFEDGYTAVYADEQPTTKAD